MSYKNKPVVSIIIVKMKINQNKCKLNGDEVLH